MAGLFGKKDKRGDGAGYLAAYREMVGKVGAEFESLLWSSEQTQEARFAAFAAMVDLNGAVVVDAGAGRGDFAAWMQRVGVRYERYVGMEAVEELAGFMRGRGLERCEVVERDFVADRGAFEEAVRGVGDAGPVYICFSGSLNTMGHGTVLDVLGRAWEAAVRAERGGGVVFNFLSDRCSQRRAERATGPARRFDTVAMLEWALTQTRLVRFGQDYLDGNDATIVMLVP